MSFSPMNIPEGNGQALIADMEGKWVHHSTGEIYANVKTFIQWLVCTGWFTILGMAYERECHLEIYVK